MKRHIFRINSLQLSILYIKSSCCSFYCSINDYKKRLESEKVDMVQNKCKIVEFFGVSGSGKSTLISQILANDHSQCISASKSDEYKNKNFLIRNLKKTIMALLVIIRKPSIIKTCREIFKAAPDIKGRDKLKLFLNISYAIYERSAINKNNIYLLDEGPFQIIWSYFLRTSLSPTSESVMPLLRLFTPPDKLIIVDTTADIIAERLKKRNSKEYIQRSKNLVEKISEMQQKMKVIVEIAKQSGFLDCNSVLYYDSSYNKENIAIDVSELINLR